MSRPVPLLIGAITLLALPACGSGPAAQPAAGTVTITNCGTPVSFPALAKRLFVNDGNLIAMTLALGAQEQIAAVSSVQRDAPTLKRHYGAVVDKLNSVSPEYPARETVLAQRPDVMVAGWSYGYAEEKQLTPATLRQQNVAAYVLTESCRQSDGKAARGVVEPWQALREDLANLGKITGRTTEADQVTADLDGRLKTLRDAPKAAKAPTVFLFDSGTDSVYSSGRFGAPEAIISDAGARNALTDVDDTWTKVSWERVAAAKPDAFLFVDYPPQSYADKVALLKARAGINELPAVKENRFLNLPYALWTSGPLNIDAAEQVRKALEGWRLVPTSGVTPKFDDRPGN
ncbi:MULTISPECIES: ABC transporter substrate-binding protein [unclassified Crossiella]|uniref:ABC transporter substrate-binding protein n=1 Tax=unclassified Crossiella TaxID=2620835 RepID=UPI001FFF6671|nr:MULTISPECIES: ABC transporter substrate-binding protein [unclassified Crossiella]MCK2238574.1 ABC transporter substrate-binding protein [Crossiella sp. S99.2]MCK2251856.1 ABC transporter substrate-binding protein [Crossiella sp. S99.1]